MLSRGALYRRSRDHRPDPAEAGFWPREGRLRLQGLLFETAAACRSWRSWQRWWCCFAFQGQAILAQPIIIVLLSVPIIIQTYVIFGIGYFANRVAGETHVIAGPSALIGASNFFELAVAVAISLFGFNSGAALATVVGVLIEVPVMLSLGLGRQSLQGLVRHFAGARPPCSRRRAARPVRQQGSVIVEHVKRRHRDLLRSALPHRT